MFRILAIDGGGIKGVFAAAALDELEQQLRKPIANYFDLIVGTSTGGIIALGLACNLKAEQLLSLYKDEGAKIFSSSETRRAGFLDWIFQPKYGDETLKDILLKYFSDHLFEKIRHPLCITSFDAASAEPILLKTRYHETCVPFHDLSVVDVALATSAAPTYFPAAKTPNGVMIDGGVWANCPVMVGITEALSLFKKRIREIDVLSIGTTSIPTFVSEEARRGGAFQWLRPAPSLLMAAAKFGALAQGKKLSRNFVRIDETVPPGEFEMDDASPSKVDNLEQLGRRAARKQYEQVRQLFLKRVARRRAIGT